MEWQEYVGYLGSILMFSSFWMKTMIALRIAGMTANIAMIVYAAAAQLYPILALQILILPVNLYRLIQMQRLVSHVGDSAGGAFDKEALLPFMTKESFRSGEVLFRAGEPSDKLYLIRKGSVWLRELDHYLASGEIFGEIGLVSPDGKRTATAICDGNTVIYSITREDVNELFYQEPEFGFFLIKLVTQRLLGNLESSERNSREIPAQSELT